MPTYEVSFCDGTREVLDENTRDDAKRVAKRLRFTRYPGVPRSAAEVKVARVAEIEPSRGRSQV